MTIYRGPGGTGEARTDTDVTEVRIIADEAEGFKNAAAASAAAASSSASAAATAETNAELAETNAETAETNAETAQAAAEAALAAAQAVYDNFDDRYLGPKASNPTLDNDGNALLTGALYFNTVTPEMRVYTGSTWVNFAASATVASFNTRTGAVTLTSGDVTTALGYTAANDSSVVKLTGNQTVAGIKTFTNSPVISVTDNTNAALRITQIGTGNALLVEDSTNPDSTPFVIDNGGFVISGYTTSVVTAGSAVAPRLQIHGLGGGAATAGATSWSTGIDLGASFVLSRSEGGVVGTQTIVDSGDVLGNLRFAGSDGTAFIEAAKITAAVDGTPGTNDMPGRLVFSTTADGASIPTERMRITNAGLVGIGKTPTTPLDVNGTVTATAFAGPLTGNVTGNTSGTAANVTGTVSIANGGTGQTTANTAFNALAPSQTSNSGKYLTTDGTNSSWAAVDALPNQSGNSGKYLTTNGTAASWTALNTDANTTTKGLYENNSIISANYTITAGNNAMSSGPITVNSGFTVTVPSGSRWVVL